MKVPITPNHLENRYYAPPPIAITGNRLTPPRGSWCKGWHAPSLLVRLRPGDEAAVVVQVWHATHRARLSPGACCLSYRWLEGTGTPWDCAGNCNTYVQMFTNGEHGSCKSKDNLWVFVFGSRTGYIWAQIQLSVCFHSPHRSFCR